MGNTIPWGVNRLSNMISRTVQTQYKGQIFRAVPTPYRKNWLESLRASWWVLTGRAEAVIWPGPSELEQALSKPAEPPLLSTFDSDEKL